MTTTSQVNEALSINYRDLARKFAKSAEGLLSTSRDEDLEYACLHLRKCIEALCYDLLTGYLKEVPLAVVETWQPKKVMDELQAIDTNAHMTVKVSFRREASEDQPAGDWHYLGEDRRLKIAWAVKAYNQLGSFLHVPTIRQVKTGAVPSAVSMRERALKIQEHLAHILAAKIRNTVIGQFYNFTCLGCGAPIARRPQVVMASTPPEIQCGNCGQIHEVEEVNDAEIKVFTRPLTWDCQGCGAERTIERHQAKHGLDVSCPSCGHYARLRLRQLWDIGMRPKAGSDSAPDGT